MDYGPLHYTVLVDLRTFEDICVQFRTIYISGGKWNYNIHINPALCSRLLGGGDYVPQSVEKHSTGLHILTNGGIVWINKKMTANCENANSGVYV